MYFQQIYLISVSSMPKQNNSKAATVCISLRETFIHSFLFYRLVPLHCSSVSFHFTKSGITEVICTVRRTCSKLYQTNLKY